MQIILSALASYNFASQFTSREVDESSEITSHSRDHFTFPTNISYSWVYPSFFFWFIKTHVLVCHHYYFRVVLQRFAELPLKISFLTKKMV